MTTVGGYTPINPVTNTNTPTLSWVNVGNPQTAFEVRIFTPAQYNAAGFDPGVTAPTFFSGTVASPNTTYVVGTSLVNGGTYRAYIRVAEGSVGSYIWSTWGAANSTIDFTIQLFISNFSNPTPTTGSTLTTSRPSLGGQVNGAMPSNVRMRREWQFADDTNFTSNVILVTEDVLSVLPTGAYAYPLTSPRLTQGTKYMRSRMKDEYNNIGNWSNTQTLTIAHVPSASNLAPASNATVPYAGQQVTFAWTFNDPDGDDFQTAFEIEYWLTSAPSAVSTTGVITTPIQNNDNYTHTASVIATGTQDQQYSWRVKVRDQDNVFSGFSSTQTFTPRDVPVVNITSPTNGGTVNSPTPTITWTTSASGGRVQAQYRVVILATATQLTVADSGFLNGATTSWTPSTAVVQPSIAYTVRVDVIDNAGTTGTDSNSFTATYTALPSFNFTVDDINFPVSAGMRVDWTGASAASGFVEWRVYRRNTGTTTWKRVAAVPAGSFSYTDYTCPSNTAVEYAVVQARTDPTYGSVVESTYSAVAAQEACDDYFIVVPENPSLNIRLDIVNSDDFGDEFEQSTMNLIGRGRRHEVGTRYGVNGSLSAQLFDDNVLTARGKRIKLDNIRVSKLRAYLRNPFGDVWAIAMSSLQYSRIAGVGTLEYLRLTLDYIEIEDEVTTDQAPIVTVGSVPSQVGLITVTTGNGTVSLSWGAPSNGGSAITDYIIQYRATGAANWSTFSDSVSATTAVTVTGLTNSTAYEFRVAAVNTNGSGAYSATVTGTPTVSGGQTAPAAPQGLAVASVGATTVTLSWSPPTTDGGNAINGYSLDRATDAGFTTGVTTTNGILAPDIASYAVTGLTENTTYYFRVRAVNLIGSSSNSGSVSATPVSTGITAPTAAPTGLTATGIGTTSLTLSWTQYAGATGGASITGYKIQYKTFDTNWVDAGTVTTTVLGLTTVTTNITGLTANQTYNFRIKVYNSSGDGPNSSELTVTTTSSGVPVAPTALAAIAIGTTTIEFTWNQSANTTGYVFEYATNDTFTAGLVTSATLSASANSSYLVSGLTPNTDYWFRVRAVNGAGAGPNTTPVLLTTNSNVPAPNLPTNLFVAAFTSTTVKIGWGAPSGGGTPTAYVVQRATNNTFTTGLETNATGLFEFTFTGLTPSTTYYFRVQANNAGGASGYTAPITRATSAAATVPGAPGTPTASSITASSMVLAWSAAAANGGTISSYRLIRSTTPGFTSGVVETTGITNISSYSVTGLTGGTTYYFRVFATNEVGEGAASGDLTVSTNSATTVTGVTGSMVDGVASLSWNAVSGNTDYDFQWKRSSSSTWKFMEAGAGFDALSIDLDITSQAETDPTRGAGTPPPTGINFDFQVRATVGGVAQPWSTTFTTSNDFGG